VKGGRQDSDENMEWIIRTLMENPTIICCPHGRPVAIEITKNEIEHLFKRI
jgi:DNA mismatch repair protein MutL